MVDLAPRAVKDIFTVGLAIKKAVNIVHQNEEDCQVQSYVQDTYAKS
jgi:hypothetical protein